jgi:hypothetical protein
LGFCLFLARFFCYLFPLELSTIVRMWSKFLKDYLVDSFSSSISSWRPVNCSQIMLGDRSFRSPTQNPLSMILGASSSLFWWYSHTNPTFFCFLRFSNRMNTFPMSCA